MIAVLHDEQVADEALQQLAFVIAKDAFSC